MPGQQLSRKNMNLIDANIALRYLLDDHEKLSAKATEIIENNNIHCSFEVVAEVVYVLQKTYDVSRNVIVEKINDLFQLPNLSTDHLPTFQKALEIYRDKNIDFGDAILCAYNHVENHQVFTFDDKLRKLLKQ